MSATRTPQALAIARIEKAEGFTLEELVDAVECVMRDADLANAYLALSNPHLRAAVIRRELTKFRGRAIRTPQALAIAKIEKAEGFVPKEVVNAAECVLGDDCNAGVRAGATDSIPSETPTARTDSPTGSSSGGQTLAETVALTDASARSSSPVFASSDEPSINIPTHTVMSDQKDAIASHLVLSRPPHLSNGKITPKAIRDFENHAENYFLNAKTGVINGDKVTRILGCFENPLISDWISVNRVRLRALTFEKFMSEFRTRWLPRNWEENIRAQILGAHLDPKLKSFETWATEVQTLNVALRGTDSHIDEDQMRRQLEANIDQELRTLAHEENLLNVTEFLPWLERMNRLDGERQNNRKRMAEASDEQMRVTKRPYDPARSSNPKRNNAAKVTMPSGQTSTTLYPPKLTEEERRLLHDHEGCLKCRVFYAGHRADKCTLTMSGIDYKTRTIQDALCAKTAATKGNAQGASVAVSTVANANTNQSAPVPFDIFVAMIFPSSPATANSLCFRGA